MSNKWLFSCTKIFNMIGIKSVSTIVLGVYAVCGGLLICCLETQLKFVRVVIAVNFGFLFNSGWRFLFYLLLGSVAWSYDDLLGQIVALGFVGVAFFNTYVLCRYPSYRKMREKIAEEEDRRIEARISKEVKQQALRQMTK
jgi:COPI associated protein